MFDSQRYRYHAAECLLAAKATAEPHCRKLRLSMAASWLSLAHQDEAMNEPLANWHGAEDHSPPRLWTRQRR
jgi:hypothetical protein